MTFDSNVSGQAGTASTRDAPYATVYLVRHGETEWNTRDVLQGHLDSALTENGLQQARELAEQLAGVQFDAIYSSDVARAVSTAEILAAGRQTPIKTSALLRERNWGRYDGKEARLYREECRSLIERYERSTPEEQWNFRLFADIESFSDIFARLLAFLSSIAATYSGYTVLAVSHMGVLACLLLYAGRTPASIANGAWVKFRSDGKEILVDETEGITLVQGR